jgi:hypothetical protein
MSADRDVLTSLPRARPTRRSAKRRGAPATDAVDAPKDAKPATSAKAAPEKKTASKRSSGTSGSTRSSTSRAAKGATAKRSAGAKASAKSARPSASPLPPSGWAAPKTQDHRRPGVGTAIQAVGELAQIGLTFGGQAVRQALSRLPKP